MASINVDDDWGSVSQGSPQDFDRLAAKLAVALDNAKGQPSFKKVLRITKFSSTNHIEFAHKIIKSARQSRPGWNEMLQFTREVNSLHALAYRHADKAAMAEIWLVLNAIIDQANRNLNAMGL